MNNEKKYREIAKFCMKQKADENIAKEYEVWHERCNESIQNLQSVAVDFRSVLEKTCQNDI